MLKCFDHGCKWAANCLYHTEGEPEDGERWMKSLFPYDVPLDDDCPHFTVNTMNMKEPYP